LESLLEKPGHFGKKRTLESEAQIPSRRVGVSAERDGIGVSGAMLCSGFFATGVCLLSAPLETQQVVCPC
jgi:hypothetical protein